MTAAEERQHMVFTHAVDLDVLDDDHAAGLLRETRSVDQRFGIGAVPRGEELQCLGYTLRRIKQPLALRVFTDFDQQFAHQASDFFAIQCHGR